jgi:hypothetical protein
MEPTGSERFRIFVLVALEFELYAVHTTLANAKQTALFQHTVQLTYTSYTIRSKGFSKNKKKTQNT